MSINNDIIETLNDLIETSKDGEYGFNACAKHVSTDELKNLFIQRATECQRAAAELQPFVLQFGGTPEKDGTVAGTLHRGWVAVRGSLTGYSDAAVLEECERGEDAALARYRKALKQESLTPGLRAVVERQLVGVQANHDQVKRLRDQHKATL